MYPEVQGVYLVDELTRALDRIDYAVLCVTPENRRSRWTHFEAGALMKPLGRGRVVPFVYGMGLEELDDPLRWFSGRAATAEGTSDLFKGMAVHFKLNSIDFDEVQRQWRQTITELDRLTRRMTDALQVGRENQHHNRILDNCQVVQNRFNLFRKYLCSHIISDVYAATNELAHLNVVDYRTPEAYVRAAVGYGHDRGSLGGALHIKALCGGKMWDSHTVDHYYQRNYEFAESGHGRTVRRLFVEPKAKSFTRAQWLVIKKHHEYRRRGVVARILPRERRIALSGIDPIVNALIDDGFGFFSVESAHTVRVFTHLGGEPGGRPFRFAEYCQPLSTRSILELFDVLDSNAEDFNPKDWPRPPHA